MTSNKVTLILLLALPAAALLFMSCGKSSTPQQGADPGPRLLNVRVETVEPSSFSETLQIAGIVKAYEDVMISCGRGGGDQGVEGGKGRARKKGGGDCDPQR